MKTKSNILLSVLLSGLFVAIPIAYAQTYNSQKALEDESRATADDLSFLEFVSESSWGQTSRCQLQYRVAGKDNPFKSGATQIVQGSVTSDYYKDKPINFVLNVQPLRLEVNPASKEASSKTVIPKNSTLIVNGLNLNRFKLDNVSCDAGICIAYAPKTGDEILEIIKAIQSKPIFDAEVGYSAENNQDMQSIRLSNVTAHGITNSEVRTQFTTCLKELMKKEISDIKNFEGAKN